MNFRLSLDERLRAAIIGVPSWSRRKREIEDRLEKAVQTLRDLRRAGKSDDELRAVANEAHLPRINDLIDRHNRFYPIEANLPLDLRTGHLLERGGVGPWKPMAAVSDAALLAQL